jgi:hypothetical protein
MVEERGAQFDLTTLQNMHPNWTPELRVVKEIDGNTGSKEEIS